MKGFLKNSSSDQRLLIKALALVGCVRLGLWILPFRTMRAIVARISRQVICNEVSAASPVRQDRKLVKRTASAVRRASRYIPAASCLTQALATQMLLARGGQVSDLRIGVSKDENGELIAHAWVVSHGRIVIGLRGDLRKYTVLNRLEEVSL